MLTVMMREGPVKSKGVIYVLISGKIITRRYVQSILKAPYKLTPGSSP